MVMDIVEKSWEAQKNIEERVKRLGNGRYMRVLKMARKPTTDEYIKTVEITGIGLIIVGLIGYLIYLVMYSLKLIN